MSEVVKERTERRGFGIEPREVIWDAGIDRPRPFGPMGPRMPWREPDILHMTADLLRADIALARITVWLLVSEPPPDRRAFEQELWARLEQALNDPPLRTLAISPIADLVFPALEEGLPVKATELALEVRNG